MSSAAFMSLWSEQNGDVQYKIHIYLTKTFILKHYE